MSLKNEQSPSTLLFSDDPSSSTNNKATYIVKLSVLVNSENQLLDSYFSGKFIKMIAANDGELIVVGENAQDYKDLITEQASEIKIRMFDSLQGLSTNLSDVAKTVFVSDNMLDIVEITEKKIASKTICLDTRASDDVNKAAVIAAKLALLDAALVMVKETKDKLQQYSGAGNQSGIQNIEASVSSDKSGVLNTLKSALTLTPSEPQKLANTTKNLDAEIASIQARLVSLRKSSANSSRLATTRTNALISKVKILLKTTDKILQEKQNSQPDNSSESGLHSEGNKTTYNDALNKLSALQNHPTTINHYRTKLVHTFIKDMVLTKAQILQVLKNVVDSLQTTSILSGKIREKNFYPEKSAFYSDSKMQRFVDKIFGAPKGKSTFKLSELSSFLSKLDYDAKGFLSDKIAINTVPYTDILIKAATGISSGISPKATCAHKFFDALGKAYRDPSSIDSPTKDFDDFELNISDVKAVFENLAIEKPLQGTGKIQPMYSVICHKNSDVFFKPTPVMSPSRYTNAAIQSLVETVNNKLDTDAINFGWLYRMLTKCSDNGEELAKELLDSVKNPKEKNQDSQDKGSFAKNFMHALGQEFAKAEATKNQNNSVKN